jgi:hypothetical protein
VLGVLGFQKRRRKEKWTVYYYQYPLPPDLKTYLSSLPLANCLSIIDPTKIKFEKKSYWAKKTASLIDFVFLISNLAS